MNQKYINIIALGLLLIGIIWVSNTDHTEGWKRVIDVIKEKEFQGVIIEKYIDGKNHNEPIAILSNNTKINLWYFYNDVNVGDSIHKQKGTTSMVVYREGKYRKLDFKTSIEKRRSK